MTGNLPKRVLTQTLSDVLSDLAFLFCDETVAPEAPLSPRRLEAIIRYDGSASGELTVEADESFARLLATNMLGAMPDGPDADDRAADALREFLNVLCGQFVTALHGDEDVFDFSIPAVRQINGPVQASLPDDCAIAPIVAGRRLLVRYAALESRAS